MASRYQSSLLLYLRRLARKCVPPFGGSRDRRTLIIGAGERAERVLREVKQTGSPAIHPVGLISLDDSRTNRSVGGVRVLGTLQDVPRICKELKAEFAIIALEADDLSQMQLVVDQCIAGGVEFKTLPPLQELAEDAVVVSHLRNVRLEEVVGGTPIDLDPSPVSADLQNRVILLTGAAGSIGSELARQIAPFRPSRLVLLDQAESDLYFIHLELKKGHPELDVVPVICDITNSTRLAQIYAQHRPDYVVHAAAYKHVPLMETNVEEAVRNNVLGTLLVVSTAVKYGARKVLLLSSDKAIKPSSVMGATKRIAERIIFELPNLHRSGTDFRAVRFGNVMGSRGSVIPLFQRQLAAGGPITVTDPMAERYLMTIPAAAQLVLHAGSLPEAAGAIVMLEMGEPVRILRLAEKLIRFSGQVLGRDVFISFSGLRPGEKLSEDQISGLEATVSSSSRGIRITQTTETGGSDLVDKLSQLFTCVESGDPDRVRQTLRELVPECVAPLAEVPAESPPALEPTNRRSSGAWQAVLDSSQPTLRERRRQRARSLPTTPDLNTDDRRRGIECRRKEARAGGRRSTDAAILLAADSFSPL